MKILVVEDEKKVANSIKIGLQEQSFEVDVAYDGFIGKRMAMQYEYDLILLDINLPQINGYDLCKEIRQQYPKVPIIMLTALGAMDDKIYGFETGADDYIVKPFEFRELLARIKVFLKRASSEVSNQKILKLADLEVDLDSRIVRRAGINIDLTAKEFSLLVYLLRHKGKVVSKVEIAEKIWDITFDTGTNVIEVYVNFLRKKIDRDFNQKLLHTRTGMGYIMKETEL